MWANPKTKRMGKSEKKHGKNREIKSPNNINITSADKEICLYLPRTYLDGINERICNIGNKN